MPNACANKPPCNDQCALLFRPVTALRRGNATGSLESDSEGLQAMPNEIHVIADTNTLLECRKLEDLPWEELGGDPVVVLFTRPVLDEIDKHKNSNGRTRRRAVDAFKLVRKALAADGNEMVLRHNKPRVLLRLSPETAVDSDLDGSLDYTKNDNRLIGILSTLTKRGNASTLLLTHDVGPASSANSLGLPYLLIPDHWLLPPQQSKEEKDRAALRDELEKYRKLEPKITGSLIEPKSTAVNITRQRRSPLSASQIESALKRLESKHPKRTDFGVPPPRIERHSSGRIDEITFAAPSDEEINHYQNVSYPSWLSHCRQVMEQLHEGSGEGCERVSIRLALTNEGSRPATNVLLSFRCDGDCALLRATEAAEEQAADTETEPVKAARAATRFPKPPTAPQFTKSTRIVQGSAPNPPTSVKGTDMIDSGAVREALRLSKAFAAHQGVADKILGPLHSSGLLSAYNKQFPGLTFDDSTSSPSSFNVYGNHNLEKLLQPIEALDPERFYYKGWPRGTERSTGELSCERWRHQSGSEIFEFDVVVRGSGSANGVLTCSVHADNLTIPFDMKVVFRCKVVELDLQDDLDFLIEDC